VIGSKERPYSSVVASVFGSSPSEEIEEAEAESTVAVR
jgi:hypothetical protein